MVVSIGSPRNRPVRWVGPLVVQGLGRPAQRVELGPPAEDVDAVVGGVEGEREGEPDREAVEVHVSEQRAAGLVRAARLEGDLHDERRRLRRIEGGRDRLAVDAVEVEVAEPGGCPALADRDGVALPRDALLEVRCGERARRWRVGLDRLEVVAALRERRRDVAERSGRASRTRPVVRARVVQAQPAQRWRLAVDPLAVVDELVELALHEAEGNPLLAGTHGGPVRVAVGAGVTLGNASPW